MASRRGRRPPDLQGLIADLRCRGRGVLAGRLAAPGSRLRRDEVDPPGHHLHPAIGDGRARHLWPDAHGRAGRGGVWRAGRDVGPARAGNAGELGLLVPRLDGRLWLRAGAAGAIYHRERTGEGQWIDASQCESGIFLTGATILDWAVNERVFRRYGNRSPYKPAAPHGAYRCEGKDRWIAIACFTDAEWRALAEVAGQGVWLDDRRFDTLEHRLLHQDALDAAVGSWTRTQDGYDCMMKLQRAGVPAGVCQNAEDRVDTDPQLRHLTWLTEVTGTKIGTWPVYEIPMKLSKTPAYIGGPINRGAPCYGEDNMYVLTELLGRTPSEVERLAEEGVI